MAPWIVPWEVMMPAFLGAIALTAAVSWVVGRKVYAMTWDKRLSERAQAELRIRKFYIRRLRKQVRRRDAIIAKQRAALRGIVALAASDSGES